MSLRPLFPLRPGPVPAILERSRQVPVLNEAFPVVPDVIVEIAEDELRLSSLLEALFAPGKAHGSIAARRNTNCLVEAAAVAG